MKGGKMSGALSISSAFIVIVLLLIGSSRFFHTNELRNLTTQCLERGGTVQLEIHNSITNSYSFSNEK